MKEIVIPPLAKDEFFEEFVNVTEQTLALKKRPKSKLVNNKKRYITLMIISLCCLIISILLIIFDPDFVNILSSILLLLCVVVAIFGLVYHINMVKNLKKSLCQTTIIVDEKGLRFVSEKNDLKQNYNAMEFIIVGKYGVYVIPKEMTGLIMGFVIEYEKEVLDEIQSYRNDIEIYRK